MGRDDFTLLGRALPSWAVRRIVVLEAGAVHPFRPDDWRDAVVVVERGEITVQAACGTNLPFGRGSVLVLDGVAVLALHNPGIEPATLAAVSRRRRSMTSWGPSGLSPSSGPPCPLGGGLEMMVVDLGPAAEHMAALVEGVPEDRLGNATPCPAYTLGDLLDHVGGFAVAFTAAATKAGGELEAQGPSGDASRLGDDWRSRIPQDLRRLAAAWRDPEAWKGMTRAGGVDLPGEIAGLVALDELVIHGWDVARASGRTFDCDPASLEAVHGFVSQFSGPGQEESRAGLFGPVVEVPRDAPLLDRVVGLAGRSPEWTPG